MITFKGKYYIFVAYFLKMQNQTENQIPPQFIPMIKGIADRENESL